MCVYVCIHSCSYEQNTTQSILTLEAWNVQAYLLFWCAYYLSLLCSRACDPRHSIHLKFSPVPTGSIYLRRVFACMCVCEPHVCLMPCLWSQKRVLDLLELYIQMVDSCRGVLGIKSGSSAWVASALTFQTIPLSPFCVFLKVNHNTVEWQVQGILNISSPIRYLRSTYESCLHLSFYLPTAWVVTGNMFIKSFPVKDVIVPLLQE